MPSTISLEITDLDQNTKTVAFKGEMDQSNLDQVKEQLDSFLDDTSIHSLIFNFHDLDFINSKGIGFLVSIHTHLSRDQRKLIIVDAKEQVMDVMSLVGLTTIIPYYETLEEAATHL